MDGVYCSGLWNVEMRALVFNITCQSRCSTEDKTKFIGFLQLISSVAGAAQTRRMTKTSLDRSKAHINKK